MKDRQSSPMKHHELQYIGVARVYVTCFVCPDGIHELHESSDRRAGRKVARDHTAKTGHATWIEETTEYSCTVETATQPTKETQ